MSDAAAHVTGGRQPHYAASRGWHYARCPSVVQVIDRDVRVPHCTRVDAPLYETLLDIHRHRVYFTK